MNTQAWYVVLTTQIITESLPISSSGHVALVKMFYDVPTYIDTSLYADASWLHQQLIAKSIDHFLHVPTVLILALFFYDRWFAMLKNWRRTLPIIARLIMYVSIADLITGLFFIASRFMPTCVIPLVYGFITTAVLLVSLKWCKKEGASLTISKMVVLGLVQGCALLPGVSRFGLTYVTGRWLSLSPRKAFETSWMVHAPLLVVSCMHTLFIFWQIGIPDQLLNMGTAFVMMGATIGAWYALRCAAYMSNHNTMWWFAGYMIVPIVLWVLFS